MALLQDIISITTAQITDFRKSKKVDVSPPVLNNDGSFSTANRSKIMWEYSGSGKGDPPVGVGAPELGAGDLAVTDISGGVSLITSFNQSQRVGEVNSFDFSGVNAPSAS